MKKTVWFLAAMIMSASVNAETFDSRKLYVGGGIGFNSLPGAGSATGFQIFGGYQFDFKLNEDISTAVEVGYMDSGDFDRFNSSGNAGDATGGWLSVVESVPLTRKANMMARLGVDFGDDDGLLVGAGLQYKFDTRVALSMEYVVREHINGLQTNMRVNF